MGVGKILTGIARMVPDIIAMKKHCESLTQIKVKVESGCIVTAVCGDLVIQEREKNGYCLINTPVYGKWTLKGRVGSEATNTETVNVIEPTQYSIELATLRASINVSAPTGAVVTLSGPSTQTAESIGGFATFAIPTRGTYNVSADYKGCKSSTKQIEITGDGTKSVTLDFITLDITAPSGATIVVTQGVDRYPTPITTTEPTKIYLPRDGKWDIIVTYDNLKNTKIGDVNITGYENKTFDMSNVVNILTVNTPKGVQLSITDEVTGDIVDGLAYTKYDISSVAVFYLPCNKKVPGYKWRLMLYKGGQTGEVAQQIVEFTTPGETKEITMSFGKTYGVRINMKNENADTGITYIEEAKNHAVGWGAWKDEDIFKNIKPCYLSKNGKVSWYLQRDDYTKKEDGTTFIYTGVDPADVMVEFPKMGYQITKPDANTVEIRLTTGENVPGFCYYPFSRDTEGDCDKLYIGAYQGWIATDNKLYSTGGEQITTRTSQDEIRKATALKGAGYQQLDFFTLTLLQCLFLLIYKNGNPIGSFHEPPIGYREQQYGPEYTHTTAGYMDKKPFCWGEFEKREQTHGVSQSDIVWRGVYNSKFLGIEGLWGAWDTHLDGFYLEAMSQKYKTTYKGFNNTGSGYLFSNPYGDLNPGILSFYGDVTGNNTGGLTPIKANIYPVEKTCPLGDVMFFNPKDDTDCTAYLPGVGNARGSANNQCFLFGLGHEESTQKYDTGCGRLVYKHLAV